mgnify:CR=1 FL=1
MKNVIFYLVLAMTAVLSSCNVQEEYTFTEDGGVTYSLQYSISKEMMGGGNFSASGLPTDTLISLGELMKENDGVKVDYPEKDEDVANISPLHMGVGSSDEEISITIKGDFADLNAMQKSLKSFARLSEQSAEKNGDGANEIAQKMVTSTVTQDNILYSYDKKGFSKKCTSSSADSEENFKNLFGEMEGGLTEMLSAGKYVVKYNFPKKVKSVDNANAIISEDEKSVVVEYPMMEVLMSPQKMGIAVKFK